MQDEKNGKRRKYVKRKKSVFMLAYLALIMLLVGGTTLALLMTKTDSVTNKFNPSKVTSEVVEDFDNKVKNNVQIRNTGNIDAYIRAEVVATWQDSNGNIYGEIPVLNQDYEIIWTGLEDATWIKGADGFYYYTKSVAGVPDGESTDKGGLTSVLFTNCKMKSDVVKPEDYTLHVEIIASAIQSNPDSVVEYEWSNELVTVEASGGTLSIKGK